MLLWTLIIDVLLLLVPFVAAKNVTVDDTNGDSLTGQLIQYSPPDAWNIGQSCTECTAQPNETLMEQHTWHDSTFYPNQASNNHPNEVLKLYFTDFDATAIYVYCVISDSLASPYGNSDMTFLIDSEIVGFYSQRPGNSQTYRYNTLVYQNTSLPPGRHSFELNNGHINGDRSLVIFDYLIYSSGDEPQSHAPASMSKGARSGIIAGSTIGGIVLLLATGLIIISIRRRRRKNSPPPVVFPLLNTSSEGSSPPPLAPNRARWTRQQLVREVSTFIPPERSGSDFTLISGIETTYRPESTPPMYTSRTGTPSNAGSQSISTVSSGRPPLPLVPQLPTPVTPGRSQDYHSGRRPPSYRPPAI